MHFIYILKFYFLRHIQLTKIFSASAMILTNWHTLISSIIKTNDLKDIERKSERSKYTKNTWRIFDFETRGDYHLNTLKKKSVMAENEDFLMRRWRLKETCGELREIWTTDLKFNEIIE